MNLPLLLLLIPFPFLFAINPKERIKPSFTKGEYKWIESYANKFEPGKRCPCGKDDLSEMILAYFQWVHPETQKMQLARYLTSKKLLGRGGVGAVYHATLISYPENKPHGCVAIKTAINGANIDVNRSTDIIQREITVIESFRMTNTNHIIEYGPRHYNIRFEEKPPELAIAIVIQIGQSFKNYWSQMKDYSQEIMLKLLKQILIGIKEIHQKNFVHLDLKIDNILKMPSINDDDEIYLKLIDFGGAIKLDNVDKITSFNMRPDFAAPEITVPKFFEEDRSKIIVSKKADIWSFGMLILFLFKYTPTLKDIENPIGFFEKAELNLWEIKEFNEKFDKELSDFLAISKNDYPRVSAILEDCLKWNQEDRPTAEELLEKHLKDISTPTENADFFGEMVTYLDEQFKEISKYLKLKSKKFTKRLLHPLVRLKHGVSKFKVLNRKKHINKEMLKNTNEFIGKEQQSQNHHFVEENIHHIVVSKDKAHFHETKLEQVGKKEGKHEIQKHLEGQTSKYEAHENMSDSVTNLKDILAINSSHSTPFHSAHHSFEHLEENSPHSTPFHTVQNSPEREIHSSSSTNESEIQLADESEKSVDFGKNVLSSTELSPAHSDKKEIASKKKSCCDHSIVKFLKKAAKFCGNCLLGPANYEEQEFKKKAKKEVQKN